MITLAQYKTGNATIEDYLKAWTESNLPEEIENKFECDKYIRGLHQSNYNLYKNNIIVEFSIAQDNVNLIIYKDDQNDWVIVRYQNSIYNCITFVKNEEKLLSIVKNQIQELSELNEI